MIKAVIFHGWGATQNDNWFPWLKSELEKKGMEVLSPDMPDTDFPDQDEWMKKALSLTDYDEDTILIGHSLGSVLILRILENIDKKIKAAYLVSGFDVPLGIPEIQSFFKKSFNHEKIKENAEKIVMLNSDEDPYIAFDVFKAMSERLDCGMLIFPGTIHLSSGTADMAFPELRELISNDIDQKD